MKTKRILSALLGLVMILALLPTAAFAASTTITITIAEPVDGQPLPTTASVAESYLQVTNITWRETTAPDDVYKNIANFYIEAKPGSGFTFTKGSITATVNGVKANAYYADATKAEVSYTFVTSEKVTYSMPPANPVNVTYDTFDYRAYANIYPDIKAAYGYDAQKLWAHYVNYGKAEGRVAFAISASDNPKSGATIYKNAAAGTGYTSYDPHGPSTVPATYLDPLPPSSSDQSHDPWRLKQLTHYYDMSNAKLVAEWYSIYDVIDNQKTGWNYNLVRMNRRSELDGELLYRAIVFEKVYCYENDVPAMVNTSGGGGTHGRSRISDKDYQAAKASIEYQRAAQSDGIILLHWYYATRKTIESMHVYTLSFPTPPANPGTAGQTIPAAPANMAYASTQAVDLDGKKVEFQMYALRDASGGENNYIKVRDLALALNGTAARFSVDWDGAVNLVAGAAYTPNGSENSTPFSGDRAYKTPTSPTNVNGKASDLRAIVLTDDKGGGYTYYKLRDLGQKLGFNVGWSVEKGVFIETGKPYTDAD